MKQPSRWAGETAWAAGDGATRSPAARLPSAIRLTRGAVTLALLILALLIVSCGEAGPAATPSRPPALPSIEPLRSPQRLSSPHELRPRHPANLLLISIDTLRADRLSTYGHDRDTSPRIDALAADGVVFERAYAHSPKTAESHMSLMTSLYPEAHRVMNFHRDQTVALSPDVPTLAELLRAAGYRTAAHTGGGNVHGSLGFARGFDHYGHHPIDARQNVDAALAELEAFARDGSSSPFFLFFHTLQVHDPYLPPAGHRSLWADPGYGGRIIDERDALEAIAGDDWWRQHFEFWSRVDGRDPADVQHLRDLYDACIRFTDEQLGRLLSRLDALGLASETLVVLVSDHGEEFREHGSFAHNSVYDELLHVPLILRLPAGEPRGLRIPELVRLVDVAPTVLDLLGVPKPGHLQGRSLVPLIRGADDPARPLFAHWREHGVRAMRSGDWKLIRTLEADELFDLHADPGERTSIASDAPAARQQLAHALREYMMTSRAYWELAAPGPAIGLDPQTSAELEALGYLAPAPEAAGDASTPR